MRLHHLIVAGLCFVPISALAIEPDREWVISLHQSANIDGTDSLINFNVSNLQSLESPQLPWQVNQLESMMGSGYGDRFSDRRKLSVIGLRQNRNTILVPFYQKTSGVGKRSEGQLDSWGLEWQHRLNNGHSFTISTHKGDNTYSEGLWSNSTSTLTSFSWTSQFTGSKPASITGGLFIGDEVSSDVGSGSERRYYGLMFRGQMTVFENHKPFISFKLQRSDYELGPENLTDASLVRTDDYYSRLSAGWTWQVKSNWSLQAEADYRLSNDQLDWNFDQSRFFFGTRYDFR